MNEKAQRDVTYFNCAKLIFQSCDPGSAVCGLFHHFFHQIWARLISRKLFYLHPHFWL